MGTRADFYVRNDNQMEWLGSIGWDGYPSAIDDALLGANTEDDFRSSVSKFFDDRDDVTLPDRGWPWPWDDSRTTDYSYIFEIGKVMASSFGSPLFDPTLPEPEDNENDNEEKMKDYFPNMAYWKNVRFDDASGLIII